MINYLEEQIKAIIETPLKKAGFYYRIFCRVKSAASIQAKLKSKEGKYSISGDKMQDFVGVRVVFYFPEDVKIFYDYLNGLSCTDSKNESNWEKEIKDASNIIMSLDDTIIPEIKKIKAIAPFSDKLFMPQRLNLILRMEGGLIQQTRDLLDASTSFDGRLIDTTYEVQLRTVFSEGWHEVEHDIRYKTRSQSWWNNCENESRLLNGIYASLESSEHSMSRIVSDIAKVCYDSQEWDAMIRNHYKLRFGPAFLSHNIAAVMSSNKVLSEQIFSTRREELIELLINIPSPFSLTTDFVVCLLNRHFWKNKEVYDNELLAVKVTLDRFSPICD